MAVDTDKPAELLLFDFLTEQVEAAAAGDVLFELELHDTVYQKIATSRGVRISDAVGDMSPVSGNEIKEWNVSIQLVCYVKVQGKNQKERAEALMAVWKLEKEMYRLMFDYNDLGGRVCDVMIGTGSRSYDEMGAPYAVANIPLTINGRR